MIFRFLLPNGKNMIFFPKTIDPNSYIALRMFRNKILFVLPLVLIFLSSCRIDKDSPEYSIVINELMVINNSTVTDQNGEYDDWFEMYNKSENLMDISGYYFSDSKSNRSMWKIPHGTAVPANGYLVFWADKDTLQSGLHTNFKLSSAGEKLFFITPDLLIIEEVEYPEQSFEVSFSRNPDGTGNFIWQSPTFNSSNNISY
jgi:hypothetical protein